jgi:S1-C subfamily serine protease
MQCEDREPEDAKLPRVAKSTGEQAWAGRPARRLGRGRRSSIVEREGTRRGRAGWALLLGLLAGVLCGGTVMSAAQEGGARSTASVRDRTGLDSRITRRAVVVAPREYTGEPKLRAPRPVDDRTYRPTVVVRRGTMQGSGTIIASIDGETLVLTAAHVLKGQGPINVELHRYNLGVERQTSAAGKWPRQHRAALAAVDAAADVAVLRIDKIAALPYVARLAPGPDLYPKGSAVISVGIDLGTRLTSWTGRLVKSVSMLFNDSDEERRFLITDRTPEHGRSGGGLFLAGGELVGVCVGRAELIKGRELGVYASMESIRLLLEDARLTAVVARSERRRPPRSSRLPAGSAAVRSHARSVETATEAGGELRPPRSNP